MRPADVRQWRFRVPGSQVRTGAPVTLRNDACDIDLTGPADGAVVLHGPGPASRPVCGGERIAVSVAGLGYLTAGSSPEAGVIAGEEPSAEWVVSGVAPGVAVPVDRPVALYDTVQGDHLICVDRPGGPTLVWAATGAAAGAPADPESGPLRLLPIPPPCLPPEGIPGDAELAGALVPVRDGDLDAGLLLLLDPIAARALGGHLARRAPDLAQTLAADGIVGTVLCRWSPEGSPSGIRPPLPPAGARLWVQGRLVADPGVSLSPVRAVAWALDADGEPVTAAPGDAGWPLTGMTWRVVLLPGPGPVPDARPGTALYLPLPSRAGEPGSTTTTTPVPGGRATGRPGGGRASSTALVPGPGGGPRVLRFAVAPSLSGEPVALGCTVRVHLPGR